MIGVGRNTVHAAVCCLALTALVARLGCAQVAAGTAERASATVTGVVYDSLAHAPLAGAEVQLVREGAPGERTLFEATTDSRGRFAIENVVPGPYTAGFLRRKAGFGQFIEDAEIEKRNAFEVRDIVRDLAGMLVMPHIPGGGPSLLMRVGGRLCAPSIWVDGQRYPPVGDDAEQMLALIKPAEVAGIEVYDRPATVPLPFGGTLTGGCGVIVVWTDPRLRARAKPPG